MQGLVRIETSSVTLETANVMTNAGKAYIASTLATQAAYGGTLIGIGTGSTAETVNDTALEAEVGNRTSGTLTATGNQYTLEVLVAAGNPATEAALTEAGLFADDGTLIARTTFPVVTKQTNDTVRLQWEITIN